MKPKKSNPFLLFASIASLIAASSLQAASRWWDGGTGNWAGGTSGLTKWSTVSGAATPDPTAAPGINDDITFNITTASTTANTVSFANGNRAAKSLTFNTSGNTVFRGGGNSGVNVSLTVGSGGITLGANSGNVTIGQTPSSFGTINVILSGSQIWTNNSSGTLTVEQAITGNAAGVGLTKNGNGLLQFNSTNTYSGSTAISAGTLALGASGTIDNTSGVILGTGTFDVSAKAGGYSVGNLSGSGTVIGGLTVSNSLAIGTSPGTISFESLTLASTTTFTYEVDGGTNLADLGNVSSTLNLGDATLSLVQLGAYTVDDKFTLFAYPTGDLSGTFSGRADGDEFTDAGGLWKINYFDDTPGQNGGTGTSFVTITAIPEPSAALLGGLGALLLLRRRRA